MSVAIIELSDYERWKADQRRKAAAGANVVLGSIETNPDEVAGDMTLGQDFAKITGRPVPPLPLLTEYRPVFQQAIERSKNATILSSSPMLADWLKKPENAALARDDLEGLSWFETTMGAGANALKRGVARVPQGVNQMLAFGASQRLADEGRSFGDILSDETVIRNRDGEALGNRTIPGPDDLYFAGTRYLQSRLMPLLGMDAEEAAVGYQQAAGEIAQRIAAIPMSPAGSRYRDVFATLKPTGSMSGDFSQFVSAAADDPAGFLAFLSEVAAESIPMLGATAVVAGATRNVTTAAAFMGTMSGATEAGVSPMQFFQERGVDVSTPDGALAAVMDVDLMREAQKRGVIRGVVIGALDGLSGGVAGQQLAKSPIGNVVLQSVAQAFLGGLGEASAQVAAGQEFNLNDVLIEALAEFVTAPIEVGAVGAGQFVRGQRAARDAETRQALFQELSGQAVNSKLRARMPDAFRQFLERATENGPVENVFVPADKFVEYFQGAGLDPFALVDALDGVTADTLRDALATGGDLQIPTATYAASIAGSEHDAFLMENMRFDPDEFTSVEAREFNERAAEALNEAYAEADRMRAEDERFKSFEAEIYETMVERLRMAGRSTDVATNEAMLYPAFYRVMAERSNLTIEEFMQRYPLPQVRGELPQGVQSREVDELTRTLAEARAVRNAVPATQKTPLLEFISNYGGIIDRGGELRARDAEVVRRGRGRKNLRLARDPSLRVSSASAEASRSFGPDDVAMAAIEAGLMADNPVAQEYRAAMMRGDQVPDITLALFDEIDKEMRGSASMTADDMNADVSDDDRMQALEEYLSQIGVSLDDSDADIRAAIEADQAERGRAYGQPDTELVGDVVPENGLLLLHGSPRSDMTAKDIEIIREGQKQGKKGRKLGGFYATAVKDAQQARGYANMTGPEGTVYEVIIKPGTKVLRKDGDITRLSEGDINRWVSEGYGLVVGKDPRGRTEYVVIDKTAIESVAPEGQDQRRMYGQDGRIATDSEAFKAWFGDSKVVGPDGQPLVVYHGTNADFEAFDPARLGEATGAPSASMGFFFASRPEVASSYADVFNGYTDTKIGKVLTRLFGDGYAKANEAVLNFFKKPSAISSGGNVMPVYLSIQNPMVFDFQGDAYRERTYADLIAEAKAKGHDGVVLRNTVDEGFNEGGDAVTDVYVAFTPTQIKSVNNRGTFDRNDPRILYQGANDASPQIDRPLYVVHNLSADKLRYATELGGLAAPSLAIARGDIGFDQFGEISLIGDPSMADPKKKGVRAFNADVYSPRQPRARFKVKEKDANRVFKAVRSVADDLDLRTDMDISGMERDGLSSISANMGIKAAWLRSLGEDIPVQYRELDPAPVPIAGYEAFTGTDFIEMFDDPAFQQAVQASKEAFVAARDGKIDPENLATIRDKLFDESGKVRDEIAASAAKAVVTRNMQIANYVPKERGDVDQYRTSIAIDEQIAGREDAYSAWVRSEFGDVIGDAYFEDANGRRREYTMANIVREMTRGLRDAEGFNYGVGNVRATVAPEFRTMTEIKAARGQVVDSETMDRLKTEVGDELFALADKFAPYHWSGKSFGFGDIFSEFLKDMGKGRRFVEEWQTTIFSEPVPDELLAEAGAYLQKLRDLPTEYFEIKMQRAVGLDEFKVALVPEKASDEAVATLKGAGLEVLRYGVEGRQAALQRVAGKVFFQQETPNLFEIQGLRSAADLGSGPVPAMDRVADALGAEIVSRAYDTSGLGDEAVLRANGTDLQISIREDETGIYLINIASKVAGDLTERRDGSGVGAAAINALKSYSDETGKPFAVVGSTDPARGFYERMGLTPGDVTLFMDDGYLTARAFGKNESGFVYRPSGRAFDQKERGSIQFPAAGVGNGDTVISLFRSADLSTLMHESGHYFLTVMQDMAQKGEPGAVEEFQSVKDWWRSNAGAVAKDAMRVMPDVTVTEADVIAALDGGTTGDVLKDAAIDVGMQEQFARGFEAYLMEGKAPSQALRGAFEKFRAWLLSVYKSLRGLNVEVSPEIRRVFDRMLATDDEIANAAEASGNLGSVFTSAEDMGLSAEDYAAFLRLAQQAEDEASQKLLAETMAPIQRETEKWFKDEKAKVRAEVEREVNSQRHYRAWEWMGNRRWLGAETPQGLADMRMSKDMLVARYGAGVLKTLPRGKQTLYAVEGGVDPDVAADVFGFSSGDEMIKALERAVPRKEAIEAETDRVMFERHGDPLADGSVQQMALDAVHGDKRARTLAVELKALTDVAGSDRGITHKEAREIARQTLSRTKVRDAVAANRYLTAERKAGEEAQRLAATVTRTGMWMDAARRKVGVQARAGVREGDTAAPARVSGQVDRANTSTGRYNENVQKLIEAKRRQLLNHAMYAEARRIAAEVESAERLVTRLQKKSTREKLAGDYLEAIDELLQRYDFRKISGRSEDRRGALLAYVERMTAEGRENELAIPDRVLQDAQRTPYKKITVEHLRGVVDSLKNIEHTARLKRTLQDAQSQRELDAVVEDIVEAFDKNLPKRPPARVGDNAEGRRRSMRGFLDLVLNATTLLREIDGFEDLGAAYRNLKAPIDAAMNRLQGRRQKAAEDLDALYDVYTAKERRAMAVREFIPEVGASLSKWERIAVALNMGNEGNYQRLTDTKVRGGFTEPQVAAIVATLDARDAAFIQAVWDYLETFRPDIEAREKRATGVAPKWVEARPVEIAGRTLNGGYYPLRYDPRLSSLARDDATQDIAKSLQAGRFGKAQTRNGHLKERAQSSGRAVELDIAVLHKHVQQVVYDIELSEPVNNSWRILQDARIRDAFMNSGKQTDFDALEIWLKDVAEGELMAADVAGAMARRIKSNFTAAKLAFNLSTVAVQITGVAQSMVVVGKKDFLNGVVASMRPGVIDEIAAKSQFMNDRQTTFNKDIFDLYNDPKLGPVASRWTEIRNDWIAPAGFWLMTKVQFYLVDMPTWLAGYQQGLRRFGNEDQAVAHADGIVKRAQASGLFSDRSAIERGSANMRTRQNEFLRLFTTLGSYMFAKFNVAYERTGRAQRVISSEGATLASVREAASWTIDMAFLFAVEAVLYAAIKGRLPDEEDDEDGDGTADEWALFVARESAMSVAATIPFVRDVTSVIGGFSGGGAYGAITEELARPFQQAGQGEIDAPLVKSIINVTGLATGIPSGQINRAVDAGWRAAEGEAVSPAEYLLGRMGN